MTMSRLSGRSRSKFLRLLCRTPRRRIIGLADDFDMQAECNGADLRVNEQIVSRIPKVLMAPHYSFPPKLREHVRRMKRQGFRTIFPDKAPVLPTVLSSCNRCAAAACDSGI